MINTTASALLHNTVTRMTLGNTPLHAVPIAAAQHLRPLLESSTSLTAFTVHTQFTPPESLRLLLLGVSRCRSLQYIRLVGGISVLQSKMMMTALTHFTFTQRSSRPVSVARPCKGSPRRCPHTPPVKRPSPNERGRCAAALCDVEKRSGGCRPDGYSRLHSPILPTVESTKLPSPSFSWLNGVHIVLDLHHLDDVVAGFLLKGLERSERIIGLDLRIAPTSQAATRVAARMLSHVNTILARNARRVSYMLLQNAPHHVNSMQGVTKAGVTYHSSNSSISNDIAINQVNNNDGALKKRSEAMTRGPSALDSRKFPSRRYSPPRLQSEITPDPPLQPPSQHLSNARRQFLFDNKMSVPKESKNEEHDDTHGNECFVCGGDMFQTPERKRTQKAPPVKSGEYTEKTRDGSFAQPTPNKLLDLTQPSTSPSPKTPPSPRGQHVQQIRFLRGCVQDLNAVVVHHQIVSRESINRLVAEMRVLEDQLTENVTTKLTDMIMTFSDMERSGR